MKSSITKNLLLVSAVIVSIFIWSCRARVEIRTAGSGQVVAQSQEPPKQHPVTQAQPKVEPTPPTQIQPTPPSYVAPAKPPFQTTAGAAVTVAQNPCPNQSEQLNGIDDDCDGQIDEDWVKGGTLQITLWWTGGPDLDLEVIDPKGGAINVKKKNSPSGGIMDKDSRSACKGGETIENIFWASNPPAGTYTVNVHYYSSCGQKANPPEIEANVGISYNGQFVGPFKKVMKANEKAQIVQFAIE